MSIKTPGRSKKQLSFDKMLSNGLKQMQHFNVIYLLAAVACGIGSAAALFEGCDNVITLNPGYTYVQSPYYPAAYPAGTSCRYKMVAPMDYQIAINCTINLNKGTDGCTTEFFYLARDGDENMRGSEQFCGQGTIIRNSLFRSVVFAYKSGGSWGNFNCQFYVTPQPCDCGWSVNTKIVNGQETGINEFPSMVALKTDAASPPFCGGTIIAHSYILTAAHCTQLVPNPASYIVKAGDHNLATNSETKYAVTYYIAQIIQHPSYTTKPAMNNDISLLRTTTPMEWTRGVGPMCLPPYNSASDYAYNSVDLIGWGTKSFAGVYSDTLQKATVIITTNSICAQTYNDTTIYASQICTYDYTGTSKDSCQYDSGGPVIKRGTRQFLLGCISFGKFCGQGGYATGVNTRISSYLTWIYQQTGYTTCNVSM